MGQQFVALQLFLCIDLTKHLQLLLSLLHAEYALCYLGVFIQVGEPRLVYEVCALVGTRQFQLAVAQVERLTETAESVALAAHFPHLVEVLLGFVVGFLACIEILFLGLHEGEVEGLDLRLVLRTVAQPLLKVLLERLGP